MVPGVHGPGRVHGPGGGVPGPGGAWFQGMCLVLGGCAWSWGCLVPGDVPGPGGGGCAWSQGGWGLVSKHALRQTPLEEMATAADGTHPTGMHSCLN